jgi:YbbR domain-containing protein
VHLPEGLVLVNPQAKVNVSVLGLKDAIDRLQSSSVGVTVDLTGAKPGPNQTFYGHTKVVGGGVTPQTDTVPLLLNIDTYARAVLDIEVRLPQPPAGLAVANKVALCAGSRDPCKEGVSGPASVLEGLKAYVRYDSPITNAGSIDSPSQPVLFEKNGKAIDLRASSTEPPITIEQQTVAVHIDAVGGTFQRQVVLNPRVINSPPCGYQVSVDVSQPTATITGPIDQISKIGSITLDPAINLATVTGSQTLTRNVTTGSDQVKADPSTVRVNVNVTQVFSCAAPSPTPVPTR